jgi:thiamine kinase-like enzyme
LAANLIDDGTRLWLVDWEYSGAGHPLFDLANASANARLSEVQDCAFFEAYRRRLEPHDLVELQIFKAASLLREALWSAIQSVCSDIAFDYNKYTAENLEACRAALSHLE